MSTVREQILEAFETKWAVPTVTVYRSREAALARSEGNSVVIAPEAEQIEKRAMLLVLRDLTVVVSVIVRGDIPDQVADPILQAGHAALMADPTLGGVCSQVIEHSTEWKFAEADLTACEVTARYMVRYQTAANDLTQPL